MSVVQGLSTNANSGSVTVDWDSVSGATGYNIYWAREPYIDSTNIGSYSGGDWEEDVSSPYTINVLSNNSVYYFLVTATEGSQESDDSVEVSATPLSSTGQVQPTAQEVLMLELVNRARFDPEAEADRYGIDLNDGLSAGTISSDQKPPLAHNRYLMTSSRDHSQWMLNTDTFSHTGEGGSSASMRMSSAGYTFSGSWTAGENIAVSGTSGSSINITSQIYSQHEGLFESSGHRVNILRATYRELGIGQRVGTFYFSAPYNRWFLSSMVTQNFARSGSNYFVTGVVYNDSNGNNFYDVGEGLSGVSVNVGGASTSTQTAGNYAVARGDGTYTITVTGGSIPGGSITDTVTVSGANRKFDVIVDGGSYTINSW